MPLYSDDTATRSFLPLEEIPSSFSDMVRAQAQQTITELPSVAARGMLNLSRAEEQGTRLSKDSALEVIDVAGLGGHLTVGDEGITNQALSILIQRKREELDRQQALARAKPGVGTAAARLGVAIGTSLLDPVNVGLAFVPVIGEARYTQLLTRAGGPLGRAGVRAGIGAAEGAAGAAIVEPLIYTAKQQEQADYEMADSLANLAFGTVFGGGLHVVGGAGADAIRAWRGRPPIDVPEAAAEIRGESLIPRAEDLPAADRSIETRFAEALERDLDGAIARYAEVEETKGGRVLNTDLARELSDDYRADRTRSAAVHEPASWLVKRMYERKLAEAPAEGQDNLVLFSAGGTGAGKSTALDALSGGSVQRAQIIYDTNMNTLSSAVRRIEQALEAGKDVQIAYVWRDPVEALVNGALPRAMRMGRTVPIAEHAKTHVGAASVIKELARRYEGDERVTIRVLDNSHGKGNVRLGSIDQIPELEYNRVREDLDAALESAYRSGSISEAVYRGTKGTEPEGQGARGTIGSDRPGADRQPQPERAEATRPLSTTAADRVAAASPQLRETALRTAIGQMADGRPVNVEPLFAGDPQAVAQAAARAADAPDPQAVRQAEISRAIDEEIAQADTALEAAEEEAAVAETLLAEHAKRFDYDPANDPDVKAAAELATRAERWSRAAEIATACLIRGA